MFNPLAIASSSDPTKAQDLPEWRARVLEWVLRGILVFWVLALVSGINNVIKTYRREMSTADNPLGQAVLIISLYLTLTALFFFITFNRGLQYKQRAAMLLALLYSVGTMGLALSALSGDGRIFLFALVVLTAILFDLYASLAALGVSLLTLIVIGYLEVYGVLTVPIERQVNSGDGGSWLSATAVFIVLSVATLISTTYLLRAYERSLQAARESLGREQRLARTLRTLSNVNQLIVREQDSSRLLQDVCDELISSHGYSFVWIGLLAPDGLNLHLAASAGETLDPDLFVTRLDTGEGVTCALLAFEKGVPIEISSSEQGNLCLSCPRLEKHPNRASASFPIRREHKSLGVMVVEHTDPAENFLAEEIKLLSELTGNIGYALEKIEADARLQFHVRHQTLLADLARDSLRASDKRAMLDNMTARLQTAFGADGCYMLLWDTDGTILAPAAAAGPLRDEFMQIQLDEAELRRVQQLKGTAPILAIDDAKNDPRVSPRLAERLSIGALLAAPMQANGSHLGLILLAFRQPRNFNPAEVISAGQAADQAALTLAKGRLDEEIRAKAGELEQLYASSQDMAASLLDPPTLLEKLARHIADALGVTSSYVLGIDPVQGAFIELAEYWTSDAAPTESIPEVGRVFQMRNYPTVVEAILKGETLTLQRDDASLSDVEREQFIEYGAQTMLFIPLMARGQLLGDLELWESRFRRDFTPNEIQLAQGIAAHAASIIESANLYKKMEQSEAYFRALIENSAEGVVILDPQGRLRYVASAEERLTGYDTQTPLGKTVFELQRLHPDDIETVRAALQEGMDHPGIVKIVQYRLQRSDGQWRYFEATGHSLVNDPQIAGIIINYRDITERKLAEQAVEQHTRDLSLAYDNTLAGWARALELRDELTEGHTRRVTELTLDLARAFGLPENELAHIRRGALLHDIGKMGIPDSILHKPGPLTAHEQRIMQMHPQYAYELMLLIPFLQPAIDIPYCHHEKWDGTGYPRGLRGEQIPLAARIFSVADVWDALTTDRPYRAAWSKEKAREYISTQSGLYFDPKIVAKFLELLDARL